MINICTLCKYGPKHSVDCVLAHSCPYDYNEVVETEKDIDFSKDEQQASEGLRFLVYDLEEDPFKIFLDVTINEAEELITRPELFSTVVDFFAAIRKEGYNIAILKAGDSL